MTLFNKRAVKVRALAVLFAPLLMSAVTVVLVLGPQTGGLGRVFTAPMTQLRLGAIFTMVVVFAGVSGRVVGSVHHNWRSVRRIENDPGHYSFSSWDNAVQEGSFAMARAEHYRTALRESVKVSEALGALLLVWCFTAAQDGIGLLVLAPALFIPNLAAGSARLMWLTSEVSKAGVDELAAWHARMDHVPAAAINGPWAHVLLQRAEVHPDDQKRRDIISAVAVPGVTFLAAVTAATSADVVAPQH